MSPYRTNARPHRLGTPASHFRYPALHVIALAGVMAWAAWCTPAPVQPPPDASTEAQACAAQRALGCAEGYFGQCADTLRTAVAQQHTTAGSVECVAHRARSISEMRACDITYFTCSPLADGGP